MTRLLKGALLLIMSVVLLSACSANVEDAYKATDEKISAAFNSTPKKVNNKNKEVHFYLPFGFEIKEKTQNNVILKNGSKTYILFYNQQESTDSKVVYNATLDAKKYNYQKTYQKGDKFGFMLVKDLGEDKQELTVGIGGVKLTTETKTKSMKNDAEYMMQIVNSVKMEKSKEEK